MIGGFMNMNLGLWEWLIVSLLDFSEPNHTFRFDGLGGKLMNDIFAWFGKSYFGGFTY